MKETVFLCCGGDTGVKWLNGLNLALWQGVLILISFYYLTKVPLAYDFSLQENEMETDKQAIDIIHLYAQF